MAFRVNRQHQPQQQQRPSSFVVTEVSVWQEEGEDSSEAEILYRCHTNNNNCNDGGGRMTTPRHGRGNHSSSRRNTPTSLSRTPRHCPEHHAPASSNSYCFPPDPMSVPVPLDDSDDDAAATFLPAAFVAAATFLGSDWDDDEDGELEEEEEEEEEEPEPDSDDTCELIGDATIDVDPPHEVLQRWQDETVASTPGKVKRRVRAAVRSSALYARENVGEHPGVERRKKLAAAPGGGTQQDVIAQCTVHPPTSKKLLKKQQAQQRTNNSNKKHIDSMSSPISTTTSNLNLNKRQRRQKKQRRSQQQNTINSHYIQYHQQLQQHGEQQRTGMPCPRYHDESPPLVFLQPSTAVASSGKLRKRRTPRRGRGAACAFKSPRLAPQPSPAFVPPIPRLPINLPQQQLQEAQQWMEDLTL